MVLEAPPRPCYIRRPFCWNILSVSREGYAMALAKESSRQLDPFTVRDPFSLFYATHCCFRRSSLKWLVLLVKKRKGNLIDDSNLVALDRNSTRLYNSRKSKQKKTFGKVFDNPADNRIWSKHRRPSLEWRDVL